MPNLNHRGPMGEGPMTGRRMGRCTNFGASLKNKNDNTPNDPEELSEDNFRRRCPGLGRGRGGRGRGLGQQHRLRGGSA